MSQLYDRFFAFFNGMVGGWSQVFVMQPFEIIKVRLQTQSKTAPQYSGIMDCLSQIIKGEGPLALFKGSLTPLLGVGIMGSARLGIFENFKKSLAIRKGTPSSPGQLTMQEKAMAAFATGIFSSFLVCPVEHTRIRVQIQKGQADRVYSGSMDAMVKITKQHGIKGLFRGQGPTTIREATGLGCFLTVVDVITRKLTPEGGTAPFYVPFVAGGVAGTSYWAFNYPFDYVKTIMQSDKFGDYKYPNMLSCFKDQYQQSGWKTFFRGYVICMCRSFPVNAMFIFTYRTMQKLTGVGTS